MKHLTNHIVLIGFKHVGKSAIGKNLSEKLSVPFIDLDHAIEKSYEDHFQIKKTCREIMHEKGEPFFREFETNVLNDILQMQPCILSTGGGTPLFLDNQTTLESCFLVHVTAPKGIVYERILMSGLPAFFNPEQDLMESFNVLWDKRMTVYKQIAKITVQNNKSIEDAAHDIIKKLHLDEVK
jgi:shikimate kinase